MQYAHTVDMLMPYSLLCKLNGSAKMSLLLPKMLSRGVILYITTQALTVGQYVLIEHAHKRKTRRVYKTIPENGDLSFDGGYLYTTNMEIKTIPCYKYTVKNASVFPVPSQDVTNQILPGRE